MPKEQIRKRGKRKPKTDNDEFAPQAEVAAPPPQQTEEELVAAEEAAHGGIHPSRLAFLKTGVRPAPPPREEGAPGSGGEGAGEGQEDGPADWTRGPREDSEYPFGVLDPDVKAYFRNVEDQVKDWEGVGSVGEEREDRQLFLASVLSELRGHELQVSTDPDVAVVFERLLPSLNDWGRRVVGDAVGENWETLFRHRFGSHVVQTWLTLAAGTLDREARDIFPPQHIAQAKKGPAEGEGVLPTMSELLSTLVGCLEPTLPTLLTHAHASPPVRLLLLVLTPNRALPSLDSDSGSGLVRSKRSGKWRKGQGVQGKSILGDEPATTTSTRAVPSETVALRRSIREGLMTRVSSQEWLGMGVSSVGSPAVQLLLECEVEDDAVLTGGLFDTLTQGLVAFLEERRSKEKGEHRSKPKPQPYLSAQMSSVNGTRLVEALLKQAPKKIFKALWKTYFVGKLPKLAVHPYANYCVSAGISRLDASGLTAAITEIQGSSGGRGLVKTGRTSVLLALAQRAALVPEAASAVEGLVISALDLGEHTDALVPCMLTQKVYPVYAALAAGEEAPDSASEDELPEKDADAEAIAAQKARRSAWENRRTRRPKGDLEPTVPGCLILQALVGLPSIATIDSLLAQSPETLLTYAFSPVASRLLDQVLKAPAVPAKYRRKLLTAFMGRYEKLAEDRMGSRVADTVWDVADGFMREKIARSLIPHATVLGNGQFGRFFARKLDLHLLNRRPDEWRETVLGVRHHFAHQKDGEAEKKPAEAVEAEEKKEKRKKRKEKDEIDDVFAAVEGKERKRKRKE